MNPGSAAKPEKNKARSTRVNFNLSESARTELDLLAKKAGCNMSELVRFGLMLVKLYYDSPDDEKLGVVKDGKLVKEILPPWMF